eukprot:COSAG02_NODE_2783_length_8036_cov_41.488976_2_plen_95_part_00
MWRRKRNEWLPTTLGRYNGSNNGQGWVSGTRWTGLDAGGVRGVWCARARAAATTARARARAERGDSYSLLHVQQAVIPVKQHVSEMENHSPRNV